MNDDGVITVMTAMETAGIASSDSDWECGVDT